MVNINPSTIIQCHSILSRLKYHNHIHTVNIFDVFFIARILFLFARAKKNSISNENVIKKYAVWCGVENKKTTTVGHWYLYTLNIDLEFFANRFVERALYDTYVKIWTCQTHELFSPLNFTESGMNIWIQINWSFARFDC